MANDDDYNNANDDAAADGSWGAVFNQKDDRTCRVYDHNDFFTVFVQLLLAAFALASLYLKRMKEVPRRTFSTWALDVGKQGVGACYAHVCNMVSALLCVAGDALIWFHVSPLSLGHCCHSFQSTRRRNQTGR